MDFDTEKFILDVKERPALWDSKCEDYSNRNKKLKCWEEIIIIYSNEDDTLEEKKKLGNSLMKKWRNIKDNFVKASKNLKNTKSGSAAKHKSSYVYYNFLLFLKDTTAVNETESDIANDASRSHDGPYETSQNVENPKRNKKNKNEDLIGHQLLSVLNKNMEYRKEMDNDDDKLFLLSLLSEFRKIPESNKLEARCEIIRAIKNAQHHSFRYNYPNTHWNRGYNNQGYESEYAGGENQSQVFDGEYAARGYVQDREYTIRGQSRQKPPSTSTSTEEMTQLPIASTSSQDDCSLMSELFNSP